MQTILTDEPSKQGLSLVQLFFRHWRLSISLIALSVIGAALVTIAMPRAYESRMLFLVNNDRADLVITPGSAQLTSQQPTEVTETQVNSEIELIKSHDILEDVIRAAKYELPSATTPPGRYSAISLAHALIKFQKSLSVGPIRKTNIIEVKLTASDPDKAVVMLEDLGNRYLAAHLAAHSSPGTGRFFNEQVKNYARQLVEARMAISDFHRKNGLFSLPEQRTNMLQSLQAVQSRLGELDAEIATQKARLAEANRQLASSPDRVLTQERSVPNQMAVQQLQATLTELRNRRIDLAMKFKPGDPLLTELEHQIANTSRDLDQMKSESSVERTTDLDSVRQNTKTESRNGEVALHGLEATRSALILTRDDYQQRLAAMESADVFQQRLEDVRREAQDNYDIFVHHLSEARVADSLDRERFSNVSIIESPSSSPIPVSPKLSFNLALGFAAGAIMALLLAFFSEIRTGDSTSLRQPGQSAPPSFPSRAFGTASGD